MFSVQKIYDDMFKGHSEEAQREIAASFYTTDSEDFAEIVIENYNIDNYTPFLFNYFQGLHKDFLDLLSKNFHFVWDMEEETGHTYVIAR